MIATVEVIWKFVREQTRLSSKCSFSIGDCGVGVGAVGVAGSKGDNLDVNHCGLIEGMV